MKVARIIQAAAHDGAAACARPATDHLERIADAEAKRVRKAWKRRDDAQATRANYHPQARRSEWRAIR